LGLCRGTPVLLESPLALRGRAGVWGHTRNAGPLSYLYRSCPAAFGPPSRRLQFRQRSLRRPYGLHPPENDHKPELCPVLVSTPHLAFVSCQFLPSLNFLLFYLLRLLSSQHYGSFTLFWRNIDSHHSHGSDRCSPDNSTSNVSRDSSSMSLSYKRRSHVDKRHIYGR
jgi:hypothetical protein